MIGLWNLLLLFGYHCFMSSATNGEYSQLFWIPKEDELWECAERLEDNNSDIEQRLKTSRPMFYVGSRNIAATRPWTFGLYPDNENILSALHWLAKASKWTVAEMLFDPTLGVSLQDTEPFFLDTEMNFSLHRIPMLDKEKLDTLYLSDIFKLIAARYTYNIILHCQKSLISPILEQALYHGLIARPYQWLIPMKTLPPGHLENFTSTGVHFKLLEICSTKPCQCFSHANSTYNAYHALVHDADAFMSLLTSRKNCSIPAILETSLEGMTGHIQFNIEGSRLNITFIASEMHPDGLKQVGCWSSGQGYTRGLTSPSYFFPKETFRILAPKVPGFVWYDDDVSLANGFLVDVLNKLANKLEFNYTLLPINTSMTNDSIRLWEIEESLLNNTAEFALFGYPYTFSKTKLELSEPVFENGYHIIMSGKEIPQTRLFQFLEPLNTLLWVSMLSVCSGVGIVLAIIARLHPDEWYHLAQRNIVSKEDGERFSLVNSLWFAFSSMVGQCGERLPLSMAGKIIAYAWWFFVLVACSTYTANLAAFFTASGSVNIQSLKDLARRTDVRYGTYSGYHLINLLQSSTRDPYSTVWRSIMNNRTLVETAERGLSCAEKEQYIFIGDMSAVYSAKKNKCDLIVSDRPMFRHLLHLPFRPHFPHFASISNMIVTLDNSGTLAEIERKWFAQEGQECPNDVTEQQQISMKDFKGVFIFLIIGIAIASFVGYLECLWFRFKNNSEDKKLNSDEQQ